MSKGFEKYLCIVFENHKKVSFHFARNRYVYILIGQKFIKNCWFRRVLSDFQQLWNSGILILKYFFQFN